MYAGSSIPSQNFLRELEDDDRRDGFVAAHVRTRIALLIRALREQPERQWSQAELGRRLGKPQSVVSRLEDPDYGKLTLQTLFEVAAAFKLPLYINMPNWDEWFHLMSDMSGHNLQRRGFDLHQLAALANQSDANIALGVLEPVTASAPLQMGLHPFLGVPQQTHHGAAGWAKDPQIPDVALQLGNLVKNVSYAGQQSINALSDQARETVDTGTETFAKMLRAISHQQPISP